MSQSGSGQSMSEDSTESQQSGPIASKPKTDFGKKHKKVVRILTVIAYIISVSTAAVLLSAYYVFLWHPEKAEKSTESTSTTAAMARTSPQFSQQMSPNKLSALFMPQYAQSQFVDVNNHHSHSKHAAHLKFRKSSSSPYFLAQQQHLTHLLLPPTPQSLIMQNILKSSTTPLTPFTTTTTTTTTPPSPDPTVPSSPISSGTSIRTPVVSTLTLTSAFPSLSSYLQSSVVMNIPKNDATPTVPTSKISSHLDSSSTLPTNPTNSYTAKRLLNSSLLSNPKASTTTTTFSVLSSSHSPNSDSDLALVAKIENTKTTNDHHEEQVLSLGTSTPSDRHQSFTQRDAKLSDIGNPIIIMN